MIRSRAGRNRSFCRSSRGFDIASPEQSPLDQGITIRLKSESQIARNPSPIPPFLQNRLLAQARLSLCPSDIQILHGRPSTRTSSRLENHGTPCRLHLDHSGYSAEFQQLLGRARGEQMHDPRDHAGPSGLMAGAEPGAAVAVEILVEQDEIAPMRVFLEFPGAAI